MKCVKCYKGEVQAGVTAITHSRKGSSIQVQVDGVPAKICPVCGETYLSDDVAQELFELVNPILEFGMRRSVRKETLLPAPAVDIRFPPLAPAQRQRAYA